MFRHVSARGRVACPRPYARSLPFAWAWAVIGWRLVTETGLAQAAEPPRFDHLFPFGGRTGSTVSVTVAGRLDPWPVKVWVEGDGLTVKVEDDKGKLTIEIADDAPLGVRKIRLYNEQGASWPRWFEITDLPEMEEAEPNAGDNEAQPIESLPVIVNGRLQASGGDLDSFTVQLDAGQWLVCDVRAFRLGSPVDASLQVLDTQGIVLALNNDADSFDPLLAWQAEDAGTYIVRVFGFIEPARADVRFVTDAAAVYRLTITTGPYVHYAFPAGLQRGHAAPLHLFGWNLGATGRAVIRSVDASRLPADVDAIAVSAPGAANRVHVQVGALPEAREVEPNDAPDVAFPVTLPCTMNGRIDSAGDEDRFALTLTKGVPCRFAVLSSSLGFPLDAVLTIEDETGKRLASNDDGGTGHDARLTWTPPADGTYIAAVRDLLGTGGAEYVYRLEMTYADPTAPAFRATVENHTYALAPGATAPMAVTVSRLDGYAGPIMVMVDHLPPGVTATSAAVPAKGGKVTLTLSAAADAKPAGQPVRVLTIATEGDTPLVRTALAPIKGQTHAKAIVTDTTEHVWLTVTPKPPTTQPTPEPDRP